MSAKIPYLGSTMSQFKWPVALPAWKTNGFKTHKHTHTHTRTHTHARTNTHSLCLCVRVCHFCFVFCCFYTLLSLVGDSGLLTRVRLQQPQDQYYPVLQVHARSFRVFIIHQTLTYNTTRSLKFKRAYVIILVCAYTPDVCTFLNKSDETECVCTYVL